MRLRVGNGVGNDFSHEKRTWIFYIQVLTFIVVRPARFELTAFGSGGQRSIQLSYERIRTFLICFVLAAVKASSQCRVRASRLEPEPRQWAEQAQRVGRQSTCGVQTPPCCISAVIPVHKDSAYGALAISHCSVPWQVCALLQSAVKICPRGRAPQ